MVSYLTKVSIYITLTSFISRACLPSTQTELLSSRVKRTVSRRRFMPLTQVFMQQNS